MNKAVEIKTITYSLKTNLLKLPLGKMLEIVSDQRLFWCRDSLTSIIIKVEKPLKDNQFKELEQVLMCKHNWMLGPIVIPWVQNYKNSTPLRWLICKKCAKTTKTLCDADMRNWCTL
jgi:hypothetical protein